MPVRSFHCVINICGGRYICEPSISIAGPLGRVYWRVRLGECNTLDRLNVSPMKPYLSISSIHGHSGDGPAYGYHCEVPTAVGALLAINRYASHLWLYFA